MTQSRSWIGVVVATVLFWLALGQLSPMASRLQSQLNPMEQKVTFQDGSTVVGLFSVKFDGSYQLQQADGKVIQFTHFQSMQSTQPVMTSDGKFVVDGSGWWRRMWPTWALHTLLLLAYMGWFFWPTLRARGAMTIPLRPS